MSNLVARNSAPLLLRTQAAGTVAVQSASPTVQLLKLISSKRSIKPHVRQLFLDAVRAQAFIQVLEIDEVEVLVLIEA